MTDIGQDWGHNFVHHIVVTILWCKLKTKSYSTLSDSAFMLSVPGALLGLMDFWVASASDIRGGGYRI